MRWKSIIDGKECAILYSCDPVTVFHPEDSLLTERGNREMRNGGVLKREEKTQGNKVGNTWESEKLALSAVLPNMCVSFTKLFSFCEC